jgi:hypothetical protein
MNLSSLARRTALKVLPRHLWFVFRNHYYAGVARWSAKWHGRHLLRFGGMVVSGPFRGMLYVEEAVGSAFLPKLLGTYEIELHPAIEKLRSMDFGIVVDVGAAEGYYAVGSALLWPSARIVAFETEEAGRRLCGELATRNGVRARVEVHGFADLPAFRAILDGAPEVRTLVIMDVEGAEIALLDLSLNPALARAAILVECHDDEGKPIAATLEARFRATHRVETFLSRHRTPADFPLSDRPLFGWDAPVLAAMAEHRPRQMAWLLMLPSGMA